MTVRFGLLGAGRIGKVHAKAVSGDANAKLVAVADAFPAAAEAISAAYGCEVRTIEAIEAAKDIDAVVICTPTDTHADLIERFSRAGKAVFCEARRSRSRPRQGLHQGRRRNQGQAYGWLQPPLRPAFHGREKGHRRRPHRRRRDGDDTSRDPGAPPVDYIKRSGGIFRDMTIHDFDMARFLLGEEPVAVTATAAVLVDKAIGEAGDYDSVSVILQTASGKQAVISNSRRATYGYDQRIEIHGSKGMVAAENQRPSPSKLPMAMAIPARRCMISS